MSSLVKRAAENSSVLRRAASPRARSASGSCIRRVVIAISSERARQWSPSTPSRDDLGRSGGAVRRPARRRRPSPRRARCRSARSDPGADADPRRTRRRASRSRPRRATPRRARPGALMWTWTRCPMAARLQASAYSRSAGPPPPTSASSQPSAAPERSISTNASRRSSCFLLCP